jgi:L-2-hydroxyglutarate oxidase LhgO
MENMEKQFSENKKIQVVFERNRKQDVYMPETKTNYSDNDFFDMFSADINEIYNWFSKFNTSEIEFTVNTIINTQDFTKLFIGKNNDQGLKIIIKQNENTFSNKDIESVGDDVGDSNGEGARLQ